MPTHILKFPILENIEYVDLIKNKTTAISLEGKQLEGMRWRAFQIYAGKKIPAGTYFYVIKKNDDDSIYKGQVKIIGNISGESKKQVPSSDYSNLQNTVNGLSKRLDEASTGHGVSVDMLIEVTKSSYTIQIDFLNLELIKRSSENEKLQLKNDSLNDELDNAEDTINELKEKTGIVQYIQYAKEFLQMKAGSLKPVTNLEDSNPSDIPKEIIEVLGIGDWEAVPENVKTEIIHYLKMFIQKLPMKGK